MHETPDNAPQPVTDERIAIITAGHSGDAATARSGLTSTDPTARMAALGALSRLNQLTNEQTLTALADPDQRVIARAIELTPHLEPDTMTDEALVRLLGGADDLAEAAAWALGERHQQSEESDTPQSIAPALIVSALISTATSHADALVREAAVAALGCIGDPSSLPAILEGCDDKATVRRRAVIALAAFDGPRVDAALEKARHDRDWQVRQAAEDLLAP